MNDQEPLVSVFLPTYNQEDYIEEAIDSVLGQEYTNLEVVIGDDCSTDNTWEIVQKYQVLEPSRIKAFRNERNLGITGNCNEILQRCTGKYIAFHAGDDVWLDGKINRQVQLMETEPECIFSYHDLDVFDSDTNKTLYYWNTGNRRPDPAEGTNEEILHQLIESTAGFLGALSVMIRTSALDTEARYDQRLPHLSELSLWVHVLSGNKGCVKFIPEVLARYRKHKEGISQQNNDVEYDIFLAIIENEYPALVNAVRKARGKIYYIKGVRNVLDNNYQQARRDIYNSIRYDVSSIKIFYWLIRALLGR